MFTRRSKNAPVSIAGRIYGVGISLEAGDARTAELMRAFLPPVWEDADPQDGNISFRVSPDADQTLRLSLNGDEVISGDPDRVLEVFDRYMRNHIARTAEDHVFVHAGVVARDGRAIVIPGASFSGKTSLVAALVRAGASYYSDEYAVFDADGSVLPFQKPLAIRLAEGDSRQTQHDVAAIGGVAGSEPARVGVVALLQYRSGAQWAPDEVSAAHAVVEVFGHTYQGIDRPGQSLSVLRKAFAEATAIRGERPDADDVVPDLLARLASG